MQQERICVQSEAWLNHLMHKTLDSRKLKYEEYKVWIKETIKMIKLNRCTGENPGMILLAWDEHWQRPQTERSRARLAEQWKLLYSADLKWRKRS